MCLCDIWTVTLWCVCGGELRISFKSANWCAAGTQRTPLPLPSEEAVFNHMAAKEIWTRFSVVPIVCLMGAPQWLRQSAKGRIGTGVRPSDRDALNSLWNISLRKKPM